MAKDKSEFYDFDEEACLECGQLNYRESRIPGVCADCHEENSNGEKDNRR